MRNTRDMVEREARLLHHAGVDLFAPVVRGGMLAVPECASMLGRIRATDSASVVRLICDRGRRAAARVLKTWPSPTAPPRIYHDRDHADGTTYASMHVKCLLVDTNELLVTSADFTFHGLHGNIEIAVRLRGAPAAEARKNFSHLVENRVLEEDSC